MLKKTITYVDYNGVERKEDFYFNLTTAEIAEMQMGTLGGLDAFIEKIVNTDNTPELIKIFKDLITRAYGEKSADGKRFMKKDRDGYLLVENFMQTEAYSKLFMELATNADEAAKFFNGIIPVDLKDQVEEYLKTQNAKQIEA